MNHSNIVNEIKTYIRWAFPDAEVILYGSEARGDARPDSDIDLLILLDKPSLSQQDIIEVTYPLYDIEAKYNYEVTISPIVYTRNQWYQRPFLTPFYFNVMNEGIKLQ